MRFDIFTLFPGFFASPFSHSILKRAQERELIQIGVHDIRAWASDRHQVCDDAPYGGGAGMVMKAEPLARAVEDVLKLGAVCRESQTTSPPCPVVFLTPGGKPFTQRLAEEFSAGSRLALLCGHYEGVDERAVEALCTHEVSVGDYVLTGGETAALCVVDAVARLVPGVLGNEASAAGDSHSHGLLEAPHYTRPVEWRGRRVPDVLVSGHHGEVAKWRLRESVRRTLQRRPELAERARERSWTKDEAKIWAEVLAEHDAAQAARDLKGEEHHESEPDPRG